MKIATWNVERLKHKNKLEWILGYCQAAKADILVLTETDSRLHLDYPYRVETEKAKLSMPYLYIDTEIRTAIYTEYKISNTFDTYDKYTAVCVELETGRGPLIVYGTIMGIFGNKDEIYIPDLKKQMQDIMKLSRKGYICVIGDYNCRFNDSYYYTRESRDMIESAFYDARISILTRKQPGYVDHIAISDNFTEGMMGIRDRMEPG